MTDAAHDVPSVLVSTRPPPSAEREQKHLELLVLLCVVEHVNALAARVAADPDAGPLVHMQSLIEHAASQLCRSKPQWVRTAILDGLLERLAAFRRDFDSSASLSKTIERQCAWLVRMEKLRAARGQRRQVPEARWFNARWYVDGSAAGADSSRADDVAQGSNTLNLARESLEPFAVAREYLRSEVGVDDALIDHDLQLFIRYVFRLSYKKLYAPLAALCVRVNELYYGVASFTFRASVDARPPLVDASELLRVMRAELSVSLGEIDEELLERSNIELLSLGFLQAFRFCMTARVQFEVPERIAAKSGKRSEPRVGIRLLQPLAYTNLRARIFGSLPGIEGWSEIFGGGLLRGVDSGRSWVVSGVAGSGKTSLALHLGADLAAREHLVLYFSFEETYANISDRVVAFRLYQPDRFEMAAVNDENLEQYIHTASITRPSSGLLLYYRGSTSNLTDILHKLKAAVDVPPARFQRSTVVIIDSIDALELPQQQHDDDGDVRYESRRQLRELIHGIERAQFSALLLTEAANPELSTLQHLADTSLEVGIDDSGAGRWLQIHKSRLQDFMRGRHGYRLRDGRGAALVPNIGAVQRVVRRRIPVALSENRVIPLPRPLREHLPVPFIHERSSVMIWGNERSAMLPVWLHMLTEPSKRLERDPTWLQREANLMDSLVSDWAKDESTERLSALLVVTFRTSPSRFLQSLRQRTELNYRWHRSIEQTVRWYQPQPGLTGARILADLRDTLAASRDQGMPIERIVFDEIDAIDALLPSLAEEREFGPTVFGLLATEVVTAMYIVGSHGIREPAFSRKFGESMDYCCRIWSGSAHPRRRAEPSAPEHNQTYISLYKHPYLTPSEPKSNIEFRVTTDGEIETSR